MPHTVLAWVDWSATQRDIEAAIRHSFPGKKFIKTSHISKTLATSSSELSTLTEKARRSRISTALRYDKMGSGWKIWNGKIEDGRLTSGSSGPTWIIPWE